MSRRSAMSRPAQDSNSRTRASYAHCTSYGGLVSPVGIGSSAVLMLCNTSNWCGTLTTDGVTTRGNLGARHQLGCQARRHRAGSNQNRSSLQLWEQPSLNTEVSYAKYIGEKGSHFTPEIFAKWGFQNATFFFEVQDLDFDLASVNFDPRYAEQQSVKISQQRRGYRRSGGRGKSHCPRKLAGIPVVRALYRVLLLREPDVAGLIGHVRRMELGESPDNVVRSLIKSDEFLRNYASFMDTYVSAETSVSTTLQPMMTTHRERDLSPVSSAALGS